MPSSEKQTNICVTMVSRWPELAFAIKTMARKDPMLMSEHFAEPLDYEADCFLRRRTAEQLEGLPPHRKRRTTALLNGITQIGRSSQYHSPSEKATLNTMTRYETSTHQHHQRAVTVWINTVTDLTAAHVNLTPLVAAWNVGVGFSQLRLSRALCGHVRLMWHYKI